MVIEIGTQLICWPCVALGALLPGLVYLFDDEMEIKTQRPIEYVYIMLNKVHRVFFFHFLRLMIFYAHTDALF